MKKPLSPLPPGLKYALLQIPGALLICLALFLLQRWLRFSGWIVWGGLALWLVKDALMYPLVRKAFLPEGNGEGNPMIGSRGIARERLDPDGYILVRGELWRAQLPEGAPTVEKGETVRILRMRGLTLLVEAEPKPERKGNSPPSSP
jgi:membrane protein implicated in regulation of membrane protease activity